jgi:hypothetical protein
MFWNILRYFRIFCEKSALITRFLWSNKNQHLMGTGCLVEGLTILFELLVECADDVLVVVTVVGGPDAPAWAAFAMDLTALGGIDLNVMIGIVFVIMPEHWLGLGAVTTWFNLTVCDASFGWSE